MGGMVNGRDGSGNGIALRRPERSDPDCADAVDMDKQNESTDYHAGVVFAVRYYHTGRSVTS